MNVLIFKGRNYFFLNKLVILGPSSVKPLIFTSFILLVFPLIIFYQYENQFFLNQNISLLQYCISFLFITTFFLLIKVSIQNPGIISRNLDNLSFNKKFCKIVVNKGYISNAKICETCFIIKPPRSNHCNDCNNCVIHFDHHCPWIGQCVARRNYKTFMWFIILSFLYHVIMICFSCYKLNFNIKNCKLSTKYSYSLMLSQNLSSLIQIVYCVCVLIFLSLLLGYHCYLIIYSLTTREALRKLNQLFGNSLYDKTINAADYYSRLGNIGRVLC